MLRDRTNDHRALTSEMVSSGSWKLGTQIYVAAQVQNLNGLVGQRFKLEQEFRAVSKDIHYINALLIKASFYLISS